jgi:hypothetical protein
MEIEIGYSGKNTNTPVITISGGHNYGSSAVMSVTVPFSFENGAMLPYEPYSGDNPENL